MSIIAVVRIPISLERIHPSANALDGRSREERTKLLVKATALSYPLAMRDYKACRQSPPRFHRPARSKIKSNITHVELDALAAICALLSLESRPLHTCSRSYLKNLLMWRDRFGYKSPTKKARGFFNDSSHHHVPSSPLSPVKKTHNGDSNSRPLAKGRARQKDLSENPPPNPVE